jgi:hypothetical protein
MRDPPLCDGSEKCRQNCDKENGMDEKAQTQREATAQNKGVARVIPGSW